MEIRLKNTDRVAIVDDADALLVAGYDWYLAKGSYGCEYVRARQPDGPAASYVLLHRLLLSPPRGVKVDHRDGDTMNNRRANLRQATHAQNMQNSKVRAHSRSGIRNVRLEYRNGKPSRWVARVRANGVRYEAKYKLTAEGKAAAIAWATAKRRELHGEFAFDNRQEK